MTKKVGPLKIWQWGAIVGGGLGLFLLLRSTKKPNPEEGPALVGSTNNPLGGGAAGEGGGGIGLAGLPGLVGEPGPVGAPGEPGAPAQTLTPSQEATLNTLAERLNNPPAAQAAQAPRPIAKANPFPLVNPKTGEHYRTENIKGKVIHVYRSGKRVVLGTRASHVAKGHNEGKKAATHERRKSYHAPTAKHAPTPHLAGGGHVAPRSHARPAPLHVAHPAPVHHAAAKPKPAPKKPAKKRR